MFSQLVGSGGSTFNSLNAYIVKGDRANGMDLTFASLMARAFDEPDAVYLLAAEELTVSPDGLVSVSGCGRASTFTTAARSPPPTWRSR